MAKFNTATPGTKTVNRAGGIAHKQSKELEFVSMLLTSFVTNTYYESQQNAIKRLFALIDSIPDKQFVAKSAIYTRTEFGMRSVTHLVAAKIANIVKGEQWTKEFFNKIVYRPDDMTEILSIYFNEFGKTVPNSLKKGFAKAFDKFDEYQLAKYRAEGKQVSLIDVVNIVHPVPTDQNRIALKKLVNDELKSVDTWESKLTVAGQQAANDEDKKDLKAQAWADLILNKKLGYFAALRNINNIIEQADNESWEQFLDILVNQDMIKRSLVLPFRYLTAMDNIKSNNSKRLRDVKKALNKAINIACDNVPSFDGDTLIVCDYSGSMGSRSNITSYKMKGTLFGAMLAKSSNADFMIFGTEASYIDINNPDDTIMTIVDQLANCNEYGSRVQVGHGTNLSTIFSKANKCYDRIFIFSDMQSWLHSMGWNNTGSVATQFKKYKQKYDCDPIVYSFDLAGYGDMQFPEQNVCCLTGLSEKIFDIMKVIEQDKQVLIKTINNIQL